MTSELFKRIVNGEPKREIKEPKKHIHLVQDSGDVYKPESVLLQHHKERQQDDLMMFVRLVQKKA